MGKEYNIIIIIINIIIVSKRQELYKPSGGPH
jgi:hypothetical protein